MLKNRLLYGYKIKFSGRFRKNEKAVYFTKNVGSLGRSDVKRHIDYAFTTVRMRLGMTGVKIWLSYANSSDIKSKNFFESKSVASRRSFVFGSRVVQVPVRSYVPSEMRQAISRFYQQKVPFHRSASFKNVIRPAERRQVSFLRTFYSKYSYIY